MAKIAKAATALADSASSSRDPVPRAAPRTARTTITKTSAASAPAIGAGSPKGVESTLLTDGLSKIGIGSRLLDLRARDFYHIRPLFDVLAQISFKFLWRFYHGNRSLLEPGTLNFGLVDHLVDVGVEERNDLLWRTFGCHHTEPDGGLVTGNCL